MTKPSELAAAALLPVRIIDAILTGTGNAITGLLGLRQNELQGSVELLNAQAAYLNALVQYRQTLESAQTAGVDTAALGQNPQGSGPASFGTPGGQAGDPADPDGTADTASATGPGTFGSPPAPGGGSGTPATAEGKILMTCTPVAGCVFEVVEDG